MEAVMQWIIYRLVAGKWRMVNDTQPDKLGVIQFIHSNAELFLGTVPEGDEPSIIVLAATERSDKGCVYRARIARNGVVDMYTVASWGGAL
jgi:hypothetical protein